MSNAKNWNQEVIEEFRANGGKVGGPFANMSLLLLHTIGAKSGQERINPTVYLKDGDRYVIIASKGGAPTNPDWYYNILAQPNVTVEVGQEIFPAVATVAQEPKRTELYENMASLHPIFAEYKQKPPAPFRLLF